ncbi:Copia protein [Senna tora]|uniref:Copia protein n=1 Tax=Senna tora TaxID=362788 RepID=A0A834TZM1_9FABA|nr:Copia protein [Senna tora]
MTIRAKARVYKPKQPYVGLIHSGSNSLSQSSEPNFIAKLNIMFSLKDLGSAYYFLGIEISRNSSGLHLCQSKYTLDILRKFNMLDCAPVPTPMVTGRHFSKNEGEPMKDPTLYRQVIGSLQYLTNTRPDIAFAVNKLSQFLSQPTDLHFQGVKRILRYLKGSYQYGIVLKPYKAL